MKSSFLISILIILLLSCGQEVKQEINTTITIAGKIENLDGNQLKLKRHYDLAISEIDSTGYFYIQFDYDEPDYFMLLTERNGFQLFLKPGDSIYLTADIKNLSESLQVSGDKTTENNYLSKRWNLLQTCGLRNISELMKLQPDQYFSKIDSIKAVISPLIEELESLHEINSIFKELERRFFEFEILKMHYNYPRYHAHFSNISKDSINFPFEQVKQCVMDLPMDNANYVKIDSYRELLRTLHMDITYELITNTNLDFQESTWKAADSIFSNNVIKTFMRFLDLEIELSANSPFIYQEYLNKFLKGDVPKKYAVHLKEIVSKWEHIKPGSDVPDFIFEDINGNEARLSDLKGNLVYIDLWATWCAPCIAEHPYLDKIIEGYQDKPISVVSISLDNEIEPWKKMIKDKNMVGYQWYSSGAFKSEIATHFLVTGIPRFLLIDHHGKVLDPTAYRPSSSDLRDVLDKELDKFDLLN